MNEEREERAEREEPVEAAPVTPERDERLAEDGGGDVSVGRAAAPPGAVGGSGPRLGLPERRGPAPVSERLPLEIARRIVELAEDKKAADIVVLELGALTTLADYFVICSGGSERQLDAIADAIVEGLAGEGTEPIGREGTAASHWILLDYGAVVVHVLAPPERDYYQLERHWSQARTILRVQ